MVRLLRAEDGKKEREKGFRTTRERGSRGGLERERGRKDVAFGSVVI